MDKVRFNIFKKKTKENKNMGFQFEFTCDMLSAIINNNPEANEWYQELVEVLPKYEITTVERVAGFLAQCAHESADFKRLEENLNYSESALNRVFARYFGPGKEPAEEYARNPEKIANYVYMDEHRSRKGALGNTQPGDGWRFRGRGLKQLTGRNNYEDFAKSVGMTAEQAAEYLETKKGAVESACWFWDKAGCNRYADSRDITGMTRKINGGIIGLADRKKRWNEALEILSGKTETQETPAPVEARAKTPPPAPTPQPKPKTPTNVNSLKTLRVGSKGDEVKMLQEALGINADGIFGPGTSKALREWQRKNRLAVDGIAGPKTLRKLYQI